MIDFQKKNVLFLLFSIIEYISKITTINFRAHGLKKDST